jgi:hypothetical protein
MARLWKVSSLFFLGLLSSCTITGPKFTPLESADANRGVIYIYRPSTYVMALMSALISVDGKQVAVLRNGGYVAVPVDAGEHTISHEWDSGILGNSRLEGRVISTVIDVKSLSASYVSLSSRKQDPNELRNGMLIVNLNWQLNQVAADQALPEISQCRQVQAL